MQLFGVYGGVIFLQLTMFSKNGVGAKKQAMFWLAKTHSQVAHGDISLENALLGSDGEVQDGCRSWLL